MTDFLAALGLVLVFEGIAYALFPDTLRRAMAEMLMRPSPVVRWGGLLMAVIGVIVVWMVRR